MPAHVLYSWNTDISQELIVVLRSLTSPREVESINMKDFEYNLTKGLMGEITGCYRGKEKKSLAQMLGLGKFSYKGQRV